jgi:hypothetical protein
MKKMALLRTKPLEERISELRADIDAFIDARVVELKKNCPGVPAGVIRQTLSQGLLGLGCQCAAYLEIQKQDVAKDAA